MVVDEKPLLVLCIFEVISILKIQKYFVHAGCVTADDMHAQTILPMQGSSLVEKRGKFIRKFPTTRSKLKLPNYRPVRFLIRLSIRLRMKQCKNKIKE